MVFENHLSIQKNERENLIMTEEIFMNSPLDKEEQWYEDHAEDFVPMKNQEQLLILKNLRKKQALRIKIL